MKIFFDNILSKISLNTLIMGITTLLSTIVPWVCGNIASHRKYSWIDVKNTYLEYNFYIKILFQFDMKQEDFPYEYEGQRVTSPPG